MESGIDKKVQLPDCTQSALQYMPPDLVLGPYDMMKTWITNLGFGPILGYAALAVF